MSECVENILFMQKGQEKLQGNVALFIDHDNMFLSGLNNGISYGYDFDVPIKVCGKYGRIVFARTYGYFPRKEYELFKRGIEPVFTPFKDREAADYEGEKPKSMADPMMICDILQTLYEKPYIDTFIIASGDRDFVPVLFSIGKHKDKKQVVVIGFEDSSSALLIDACTCLDFKFCNYKKISKESEIFKKKE